MIKSFLIILLFVMTISCEELKLPQGSLAIKFKSENFINFLNETYFINSIISEIKHRPTTTTAILSTKTTTIVAELATRALNQVETDTNLKNASSYGTFRMGINVDKKEVYLDSKNLTILEIVLFSIVSFLLFSLLVLLFCFF